MSVTAAEFWKLINQSQLLTGQQIQKLQAEFQRVKGANDEAKFLAQWMVARKSVTRYQAGVLLAGRPGPFFYGQYKVFDRMRDGKLKGCFRAYHAATGHPVMLKFVTGEQAQDATRWDELAATISERSELKHHSLQRIFEPVDLTSFKFIVVEDLRGETLADRVEGKGRLHPDEACAMFRSLAQALDHLHRAGIVHGQIRPDNIWLEESGQVRLLHDPTEAVLDPAGVPFIQADFLAPEYSQSGPTCLTDIYALGCTFYYALAGQVPFAGGDADSKATRHATEAVQPLTQFGVSEALGKLAAYLLAKPIEVRFPTAEIIIDQLALYVDPAQDNAAVPVLPTLELYEESLLQKREQLAAVVQPAAAGGPAVQVQVAEPTSAPASVRRPRRQKSPRMTVAICTVVLLVSVAVGYSVWSNATKKTAQGDGTKDAKNVSHGGKDSKQQVVKGDTTAPWASPTSGAALELKFAPQGSQAFISARLADMESSEEGRRVLKAISSSFGPEFQKLLANWSNSAGVASTEVERVLVCLVPNEDSEAPNVCCVVRLKEAKKRGDLLAGWGDPEKTEAQGKSYYKGAKWSYYVPLVGEDKVFVMGQEDQIKDVIELDGKPPVLRRELERVRATTDQSMHVSLLFAPNFFFGDGQTLLAGFRRPVRESLEWFLGDGLKAALLAMHFGDHFYMEMRLFGTIDKDAHMIASDLKGRIDQMPELAENYIAALSPHPYWKRVAIRFPRMMNFVQQHVRVGVEDKQTVINLALPANAAHNLIFATGMVAVSEPGQMVAATAKKSGPKTMDELLKEGMNLAFDQTSLEFSMRDLAAEVRDTFTSLPFPFDIKIIGDDLKLDGITRNQQIRSFNQQDKSLAEILTALVRKANPVTTVKDPSEKDQKLIWVIAKDPNDANGPEIILITTRAAAAKRNYKLPKVFQPK